MKANRRVGMAAYFCRLPLPARANRARLSSRNGRGKNGMCLVGQPRGERLLVTNEHGAAAGALRLSRLPSTRSRRTWTGLWRLGQNGRAPLMMVAAASSLSHTSGINFRRTRRIQISRTCRWWFSPIESHWNFLNTGAPRSLLLKIY